MLRRWLLLLCCSGSVSFELDTGLEQQQLACVDAASKLSSDAATVRAASKLCDLSSAAAKFHELGGESGYQRVLEEAGIIRRLLDDDGVARALQEPPPDTRACVRGFYINLVTDPTAISANWHEIELKRPLRHIPLPDPFSHRVPTDAPENDREG